MHTHTYRHYVELVLSTATNTNSWFQIVLCFLHCLIVLKEEISITPKAEDQTAWVHIAFKAGLNCTTLNLFPPNNLRLAFLYASEWRIALGRGLLSWGLTRPLWCYLSNTSGFFQLSWFLQETKNLNLREKKLLRFYWAFLFTFSLITSVLVG